MITANMFLHLCDPCDFLQRSKYHIFVLQKVSENWDLVRKKSGKSQEISLLMTRGNTIGLSYMDPSFVFLCLHNTPLSMFNDYYERWRNLHERNLCDLNVLHVPEGYSAIALSSTKNNSAKLWNNLPFEIRKLGNVTDFRKALQKYFVESYT